MAVTLVMYIPGVHGKCVTGLLLPHSNTVTRCQYSFSATTYYVVTLLVLHSSVRGSVHCKVYKQYRARETRSETA